MYDVGISFAYHINVCVWPLTQTIYKFMFFSFAFLIRMPIHIVKAISKSNYYYDTDSPIVSWQCFTCAKIHVKLKITHQYSF